MTQPSVVIYYITFFHHVSKVSKYCGPDKLPIGAVTREHTNWILLIPSNLRPSLVDLSFLVNFLQKMLMRDESLLIIDYDFSDYIDNTISRLSKGC